MDDVIESFWDAGLFPPRLLTLAVTGRCNLSCAHCWVDSGPDVSSHVPSPVLSRMIADFRRIGSEIRLTGGESLCHPAWLDLIEFARRLDYETVSLQTNGTLLNERSIARLAQLDFPGLSLQISLDGASASTHDRIRGTGAFAAALAGLRGLAAAGLAERVSIFFTEMRHNLEEIPDLLFLARSLGVRSVTCGTVVPCGRGGGDDAAPPDDDQYERLLRRFRVDERFRHAYEGMGTVAAIEWTRERADREGGCTFAANPYVTPDGTLFPCVMFHSPAYGVRGVFEKGLRTSFAEGASLWAPLPEISRSRALSNPVCCQCAGRNVCGGGCMGRAWAACGDISSVDDRCRLRRVLYRLNPFLSAH